MKMNFTPSMFVVFCFIAIVGYLYMTESLTGELFFIFAILIIASLLYGSREKRIITLKEANLRAENYVLEMQSQGKIPDGNIHVSDSELKDIVLRTPKSPMVEPDRFLIKIIVEPNLAYLVKVSIYGSILGCSEIGIPSTFSVSDIPDREVKAGMSRYDSYKRKGDEDDNEEDV